MQDVTCCLCLIKIDEDDNSLFHKRNDESIFTKIQLHLHVNIETLKASSILTTVCTVCTDLIEKFHEYYENVQKNQRQLKTISKQHLKNNEMIFETITVPASHDVPNEEESDKISDSYCQINSKETESSVLIKNSKKNSRKRRRKPDTEPESVYSEEEKEIENLVNQSDFMFDKDELKIKQENTESDISEYKTANDNLELPTCIVKNGKFQMDRDKLNILMARFYVLICDLCPQDVAELCKFSTIPALLSHYRQTHKTKGYVLCCTKKFDSTNMKYHFGYHMNPEEYKCDVCGTILSRPDYLTNHKKTHLPEEEREFACAHCPRRFNTLEFLNSHQGTHISKDEFKYICQECGKPWASKKRLSDHMLAAHQVKKYFCEQCGKLFRMNEDLNRHKTIHEPKFIQCQTCDRWFKNKSALRQHVVNQHSANIFKCNECDYVTKNTSLLRKHRRKHIIDPVTCEYCGKEFKNQISLKLHLPHHTGKRYQCQFCLSDFISKSAYYLHKRKNHPKELEEMNKQREEEERIRIENSLKVQGKIL